MINGDMFGEKRNEDKKERLTRVSASYQRQESKKGKKKEKKRANMSGGENGGKRWW